jgi:hypothetical protein
MVKKTQKAGLPWSGFLLLWGKASIFAVSGLFWLSGSADHGNLTHNQCRMAEQLTRISDTGVIP